MRQREEERQTRKTERDKNTDRERLYLYYINMYYIACSSPRMHLRVANTRKNPKPSMEIKRKKGTCFETCPKKRPLELSQIRHPPNTSALLYLFGPNHAPSGGKYQKKPEPSTEIKKNNRGVF